MRHQWKLVLAVLALLTGISVRKYRNIAPLPKAVEIEIIPPYLAPYSNPNAPESTDFPIVPGTYMIFLAPGHSIQAHSVAIHRNIAPHVHTTFDTFYGEDRVVYLGTSIDDELLGAIRSDPKVELVEYDTKAFPNSSVYRAPLQNCDISSEDLVEGAYQVLLTPGHSMEKHSKRVGQDMKQYSTNLYKFHTGKTVYSAGQINEVVLAALRSDQGVEMVVCESKKKHADEKL